jgi:uncharacterized protein (DUF1330 family)
MPSFFLVEILEVTDQESYARYIKAVHPVVTAYGGDYVFRTNCVSSFSEGATPERMILIRFPSTGALKNCFESEAYRRIAHLREESTRSRAFIVNDKQEECP